MRYICFLSLIFCVFLLNLSAQQNREGDIAILEITFNGKGLTNEQIGFLSDDIRGVAAKITNYRIMNKENIFAILRDKGIDPNKCGEAECEVDYGRMLQADMVVTTNIIYEGGVYYIKLKLYDVSRATLENSVDRECRGCDFSKLRSAVKDASQELFGGVVEVGELTPQPAGKPEREPPKRVEQGYGTLVINTNPAGCQIYIDSEDYGITPKTIEKVPAGERTIVLAREGYSTTTEVIRIEKGRKVVLNKTLAPQMGNIKISIKSPVISEKDKDKPQIYLDGKYQGDISSSDNPFEIKNILTGGHRIRIEHPDYETYEEEIAVRYNAVENLEVELKGKPGKLLITSTPLKAGVTIDGIEKGETPFKAELSPGKHSIRVSMKGYKSKGEDIEVKPNKPLTLNYNLEALPKGEVEETEDMVLIPAGEFWMGCAPNDSKCYGDEKPYHKVYLDAYYIDKHEVTVAEYKKCVESGACTQPGTGDKCNWGVSGRDNHPINCINWTQANAYCEWAGKRLPTEAEWEKAARGTDGLIYPWGNEWDEEKGCFNRSSTCVVGSYPSGASPYGVLDMAGNVWEWVSDWYDANYYSSSRFRNPQGPSSGEKRLLRGGAWWNGNPVNLRASFRNRCSPGNWDDCIGFRCVRLVSK
jgi:formylglycine-generating enzyme required for sulfatase activity